MKKRLLVVLIAALGATALWLLGYFLLGGSIPVKDPITLYKKAVSDPRLNKDLTLSITQTNKTTVGNNTFIVESTKTVRYDTDNKDGLRISSEKTMNYGNHQVSISETYADNQLYATVNGSNFKSSKAKEDYISQQLPVILLDDTLYSNITASRKGGKQTVFFSAPVSPENWLTQETVSDYFADGHAYINLSGELTGAYYTANYTFQDAQYNTSVWIDITRESNDITLPEDTNSYTELSVPEAVYALEAACGYLMQAQNISAVYTDNIYVQAMGDRRTQTIHCVTGTENNWSATVETVVSLSNDIRGDQASKHTKTERFSDGVYTVTTDDGATSSDTQVAPGEMEKYVQTQLISTVVLPEYISGITVSESPDSVRYTFAGSQDFVTFLSESACNILYQNTDLLEDHLENIEPIVLDCFLTVDKTSGLPINSGIIFTGRYYISNVPYNLEYHADQEYTFSE